MNPFFDCCNCHQCQEDPKGRCYYIKNGLPVPEGEGL